MKELELMKVRLHEIGWKIGGTWITLERGELVADGEGED